MPGRGPHCTVPSMIARMLTNVNDGSHLDITTGPRGYRVHQGYRDLLTPGGGYFCFRLTKRLQNHNRSPSSRTVYQQHGFTVKPSDVEIQPIRMGK